MPLPPARRAQVFVRVGKSLPTSSDDGVPLEKISRLVGHRTTTVTETVCRKQLRPVIKDAATAMNRIFPASDT